MKRIYLLLVLICLISAGWAEVLVQQDFEGETFPPAGWTATNNYPAVYWFRAADGENHYAECTGQLPLVAYLNTPDLVLNLGDSLNISFDSFTNIPVGCTIVSLSQGTNTIWSDNPDRMKRSHNSFTLPPLTISGTYFVRWKFPVDYSYPNFMLSIDNVVISRNMARNQTLVQLTTLGMIKSTYK